MINIYGEIKYDPLFFNWFIFENAEKYKKITNTLYPLSD